MPALATSDPPADRTRLFRTLVKHEWSGSRRLQLVFFYTWIICVWLLPVFTHPGWMIAFGILYVISTTAAIAGGDVLDGTEEFFFSMPPGRNLLFLSRLAVALSPLLVFTIGGTLAAGFDLPQRLWSMFVSSGITEPNPSVGIGFLHAFGILIPLAAFSITFAIASMAGNKGMVGISWLIGGVAAGLLVALGLAIENMVWGSPNGWITSTALILVSTVSLSSSHAAYARKEAVVGKGRTSTSRPLLWIIGIVVGIMIIHALMTFFFFRSSSTSMEHEARQMEMELREQHSRAEAESRASRMESATTPSPPESSAD